MTKPWIFTISTLVLTAVGVVIAVMLIKGYTFSTEQGRIVGTGIISVTSEPDGASVYIDGHLTTATDTTISSLSPKNYHVKITKEGYIPWEKTVEVKEGLVVDIKATLFPSIPTLYPLTYNGAVTPILSDDGQNLAYTVPLASESARQRGGVWVWTFDPTPIAFARGAQPHQLVASSPGLDFSKAELQFSPDSSQLLVTLNSGQGSNERNYLLDVSQKTEAENLRDVTPNIKNTLIGWTEERATKESARAALIKDLDIQKIASDSASPIKWSPDETKILIINTPQKPTGTKVTPTPSQITASVYDLENSKKYDLPSALSYQWLPDSTHIILVNEGQISIVESDGANNSVVYAGNFDKTSVYPWPDSSRLVFISSFNTPTASTPNLFGINLK